MLVGAFALGLLPGMLFYWQSRRTAAEVMGVLPVAVTPTLTPSPAVMLPDPKKSLPPKAARAKTSAPAVFDAAELGRMLAERSHQLEASQGAQADLSRQLRELEARFDGVTQEAAKLKAAEAEIREQLALAQKEADAAKGVAQGRQTAFRDLELAGQQLRRQLSEATQGYTRRKQAGIELDEIARRRESYLNNILGRYREATDMFRVMSLRLDNPRDAGSPLSNDLSRIQQAIQLADEDLRQLRALNSQAARLQKDLN